MGLAKCFTTIGALFMLIFGLAIVAGTAYVWVNDDIFLGNSNLKYSFLGFALGIGLAVIGGATDGMYGICKGKPCHLCMFQIFVIVFMVIFIGFSVLLNFAPDIVFDGDCRVSKNPAIEQANNIYNKSSIMFCQSECACALDTTTTQFQERYTDSEKAEISGYNISSSGFKNTGACIRGNITDAEASLFQVIGNVEQLLECSLWCSDGYSVSNLVYRFGNVNDGKPTSYCYDRVKQLFEDTKDVGKYLFLSAGLIMLLMFICNMYLCCCAKERKGKNLRDRFLYYEQKHSLYDRYDRMDPYERR